LFTIIDVVVSIRGAVQVLDPILENDEIQVSISAQTKQVFLLWKPNMALGWKKVRKSNQPFIRRPENP